MRTNTSFCQLNYYKFFCIYNIVQRFYVDEDFQWHKILENVENITLRQIELIF